MKVSLIVGAIVVIALIVVVFVMGKKEAPPAPSQVSVPTASDPRAAQKQFLVDNLKNEGWKATPSGLQYHVLKSVDSGPKPAPGSEVTVNYEGKFIDGRVFDNASVTITGTPTFLTDINDYLQGGMLTLGGIAVLVMVRLRRR